MSIIKNRFLFGRFAFVPTGRPVAIGGARRRLGDIEEYGPARTISIIVGQKKGKKPENQAGRCSRQPSSFSAPTVDAAFRELRANQVGYKNVAGTRVSGKGWYKGAPESSVAFEVAYVPPEGGGPPSEKSFADFQRNMNHLAETMAERFCQDEVLIVRDDGRKKTVAGATRARRR